MLFAHAGWRGRDGGDHEESIRMYKYKHDAVAFLPKEKKKKKKKKKKIIFTL